MLPVSQVQDMIQDAVKQAVSATHQSMTELQAEKTEKAIADAVKVALDTYKAEAAEAAKAKETYMVGTPIKQPTIEPTVEPTAEKLFGNVDKKKEFDLSPMIPTLTELPDDKYIIVQQKHFINADKSVTEDVSGRRAQIIAPGDYQNAMQPITKGATDTFYDVLFGKPGTGGGYVVVHKPTKKEK